MRNFFLYLDIMREKNNGKDLESLKFHDIVQYQEKMIQKFKP